MFQLEISSIQNDIVYHEKELELAKARLENIEMATEYSNTAIASLEDCLTHIEPFFLDILKDRIDKMFSDNSKDGQPFLESTPGRPAVDLIDQQEVKEETPQEIIEEEVSNHVIDSQTDPLESVKSNPKYAKTKLTEEIYYDKETQTCYLGFSNRNRATEYGYHLLEIHELFEGKHGVDKPVVVTHCKWELVIQNITESNAAKLKELNLKKVLSHKDNQAVTAVWKTGKVEPEEVLTEDVNIYIPKETVKKSEGVMEEEFPPAPYTELPLTEVEFGDVITSSPHGRSAYMVKEHAGEFVMAECLYHNSLPGRVGEDYSFSKIYLVEKCS